jgi:hypothetical protein
MVLVMYGIYANIWGILMGSMLPYIAYMDPMGFCLIHSDHAALPLIIGITDQLTVLLEVVMSTKCTCERTWKNKGTHVIKFTCSTLSKICKNL